MLELATEIIGSMQQRLPALNRSIQEIKGEWRLMNRQLYMPDLEVDQRLLSNLRRSRLDVAELDVKIEDLLNKLEYYNRQQRLNRVK